MSFAELLLDAVGHERGLAAANLICATCAEQLDVDAVAISLVFDGANAGTLGVSGPTARAYDELQFTFGEGPCLDSVNQRGPVLVNDLADPAESRWPAYGQAMLGYDVRSVYALPVLVAGEYVGALDLFCKRPGSLVGQRLADALIAAEVAEVPMLDLMAVDLQVVAGDVDRDAWVDLNVLSRAEVSQAVGMLVAQLSIEPAEALIRLRGRAYTLGRSATDVARDVLERRLVLDDD